MKEHSMLPYCKNLKEPARTLRKEMTDAEHKLWLFLRGKQILGIQFYRQKPIGPYVVDFYAPAAKMVVEADGSQHHEPEHVTADEVRDAFLAEHGLMVVRFDNYSILKQTDAVLERIYQVCRERLGIPPDPPLSKGGTQDA
jgi:very-short-patch-repair endonuclease